LRDAASAVSEAAGEELQAAVDAVMATRNVERRRTRGVFLGTSAS